MPPSRTDFTRGISAADAMSGARGGEPSLQDNEVDVNFNVDPDTMNQVAQAMVTSMREFNNQMRGLAKEFSVEIGSAMRMEFSRLSDDFKRTIDDLIGYTQSRMEGTSNQMVAAHAEARRQQDMMQREIDAARRMGATPEQLRGMELTNSGMYVPGALSPQDQQGFIQGDAAATTIGRSQENTVNEVVQRAQDATGGGTQDPGNPIGDIAQHAGVYGLLRQAGSTIRGAGGAVGGNINLPAGMGGGEFAGAGGGIGGRLAGTLGRFGTGALAGAARFLGPVGLGLGAMEIGQQMAQVPGEVWDYQLEAYRQQAGSTMNMQEAQGLQDVNAQLYRGTNLDQSQIKELQSAMSDLNMETNRLPGVMASAGMAMDKFGLSAKNAVDLADTYRNELNSNTTQMMSDLSEQASVARVAGIGQQAMMQGAQQTGMQGNRQYGTSGMMPFSGGFEFAATGLRGTGADVDPARVAQSMVGRLSQSPQALMQAAAMSGIDPRAAVRGVMQGRDPRTVDRLVAGQLQMAESQMQGMAPEDQLMAAQYLAPTIGLDPGDLIDIVEHAQQTGQSISQVFMSGEHRAQRAADQGTLMQANQIGPDLLRGRTSLGQQVLGRAESVFGLRTQDRSRVEGQGMQDALRNIMRATGGRGIDSTLMSAAMSAYASGGVEGLKGVRMQVGGRTIDLHQLQQIGQAMGRAGTHGGGRGGQGTGRSVESYLQGGTRDVYQSLQGGALHELTQGGLRSNEFGDIITAHNRITREDRGRIGIGPAAGQSGGAEGTQVTTGGVTIGLDPQAASLFKIYSDKGADELTSRFGHANEAARSIAP
jgi:hypothetical protein